MAAPPTTRIGRGAVSTVALAQAGVARVKHEIRRHWADDESDAQLRFESELGRIMFKALNQLKGTALKVSQALSAHADFLPTNIRTELAKGCHQVTPLNRALIHKVFRSEFGSAPEQLFAKFEAEAFAAASLGQVHRATLTDGRLVAVKVQYPGIGASIKSDLAMMREMIYTLGSRLVDLPQKELIDKAMAEVAAKLEEELDYENEATQLRWWHKHLPPSLYVVPLPVEAFSSRRVLTMELLEGLHLDAWLATNPSQESRNRAGQLLFDYFNVSLHSIGCVNADPHPGNFLFLSDGRLGLLDFGCTRAMSPDFPPLLRQAWNAVLNRSAHGPHSALRSAYVEIGLISAELTQDIFDNVLMPVLAPMLDWQIAPFRSRYYDFSKMPPLPMTNRANTKTVSTIMTDIHSDLLYVDRAYLGITQLLKRIGAVVMTSNPWITSSSDTTCDEGVKFR